MDHRSRREAQVLGSGRVEEILESRWLAPEIHDTSRKDRGVSIYRNQVLVRIPQHFPRCPFRWITALSSGLDIFPFGLIVLKSQCILRGDENTCEVF